MQVAGVTYPEGFLAGGLASGVKEEGKKDLALILSQEDCVAAGCFTTNQFQSFSVIWSRKHLHNSVRAVLVNSGNANACNGPENWLLTQQLAERTGQFFSLPSSAILLASTGIIGRPLPLAKILSALPELKKRLSVSGHRESAEAIMTTDTHPKEAQIDTGLTGRKKQVGIGGMAKGAGMINPLMATMLCFLTTDAVVEKKALSQALKQAVEDSFNMITVDNDRSTNDTVLLLANGLAKNSTIHLGTDEYENFCHCLKKICVQLAREIAFDGEGATKAVEVRVSGAWSRADARKAAKQVAGSNLVKSALAGGWPNWGRILSSLGATNVRLDQNRVSITLCGIEVYRGKPLPFSDQEIKRRLARKEILIAIDLARGQSEAVAWGCDLTEEYVRINREE
ncbi:MAG: bifunctional glutamate N-acetyltransferase/amino-acid acetyltransferase ArgJ [Candidatus Omnitrophica bacterium]|nr:bifunctional glutamate N-acetyltransferase/amino-acid acetyltransferase ArgJ [Candidatus Omnitrophota bacterium]